MHRQDTELTAAANAIASSTRHRDSGEEHEQTLVIANICKACLSYLAELVLPSIMSLSMVMSAVLLICHDFETLDRAKGLPDCGCCAFRLPDDLLDASLG